jgi:nicotinate-nucleotide adenylyltransferase
MWCNRWVKQKTPRRIGIYSGSFDPVHKGHISFALTALEDANLDAIYFLAEALPRHKPGISHIAHRTAMLGLATRSHKKLHVLEFPDKRFTIASTLPRLQMRFKNDQLLFLMGSDVASNLHRWPHIEELVSKVGLIVALRTGMDLSTVMHDITQLSNPIKELHLIESLEPYLSSRNLRSLYCNGGKSERVLPSVERYIKKHWLYAQIN